MTKGILCTIDFSPATTGTVQWAISLAKELRCGLTLLYTYRLTKGMNGDVLAYKRKMEKEAADKFKELETDLLKNAGVPYRFKIEIGFVADRIEDHARKNGISFLVMDKNMSTDNRETFDDLVEHMNVPLVLVP